MARGVIGSAMPRAYSVDLREKALQALTAGRSVAEVALLFGVSRKSLYRWRAQQASTGAVVPGQSPGRPRTISAHHEALVLVRLREQPDLTLAELCAVLPVPVSTTTMHRTVQRLGWVRTKSG
jgi:transposase